MTEIKKELVRLITENPEMQIIVLVDGRLVTDNTRAWYWEGKIASVRLREFSKVPAKFQKSKDGYITHGVLKDAYEQTPLYDEKGFKPKWEKAIFIDVIHPLTKVKKVASHEQRQRKQV